LGRGIKGDKQLLNSKTKKLAIKKNLKLYGEIYYKLEIKRMGI
jgi:hypothetical protein